MRRLGRRRWSIPVEAKGEAKCCNPADWSHRAMTASPPASLPPPPARTALWRGPPPSYRTAVAALLCCIWPPMWRCDRLCGANFQDLLNNRFTHKIFHQNLYKENHITISNLSTTLKYSDLKLHYQNSKSTKRKKKIKTKSNSKEPVIWMSGTHKEGKIQIQSGTWKWLLENVTQNPRNLQLNEIRFQLQAFKINTKIGRAHVWTPVTP